MSVEKARLLLKAMRVQPRQCSDYQGLAHHNCIRQWLVCAAILQPPATRGDNVIQIDTLIYIELNRIAEEEALLESFVLCDARRLALEVLQRNGYIPKVAVIILHKT